ncbi:hypothetical protein GGQ88_003245 [Novosphingobium hassiacum]|uniref:DUF1993 domain-containing protein n=1 Tax=Novosphingobium hassiacum TaxID=173676 RepID=A0A7W5ZXS7_9SPHN|nr:DUF1993 domain-containing protein [Novosphingobium hassiacum]MBB3861955.1 hypothetical protein [Novosphingobium hassiacum]
MTPTDLLAPTYLQMLAALANWLAKAEQHAPAQTDALMSARLAPDMFPLSTQIRFTCAQALEGLSRLRGEPFPPMRDELLAEGRGAQDNPGSLADAKVRIDQTLALITALSPVDTPADGAIAHDIPNGMVFDLTVDQFARDWALGQFYFHLMAAYAILRQQGVPLGKVDYVAHMFQYIRPGTMPTA